MAQGPTIQVAATAGIIAAIEDTGIAPELVLAEAGLTRAALADPERRIPLAKWIALLEGAAERLGDPCFGLHFGAAFDPAAYGALGYVVLNSPTVGVALDNVSRYLGVHRDATELALKIEGRTARTVYRVHSLNIDLGRQDAELAVARLFNALRVAIGGDWSPDAVWFTHSPPADEAEHRRVFGAPVHFHRPTNSLVFERAFLDHPIANADPRLYRILERHIDDALARMPAGDDLIDRVRELVARSLGSGIPTINEVAATLGMGTRTLQRRLQAAGLDYSEVVDSVRRRLALDWIDRQAMTATEIAFLLGYSESSAFSRAFRRWTGDSPGAYRRRQRPTPNQPSRP